MVSLSRTTSVLLGLAAMACNGLIELRDDYYLDDGGQPNGDSGQPDGDSGQPDGDSGQPDGDSGQPDGTGDAGCSQSDCNGACVDLSTDEHNCGACGHDCLGTTCNASLCAPEPVDTNTGVTYFGLAHAKGKLFYKRASQLCATPATAPTVCTPVMTGLGGNNAYLAVNSTNVYVVSGDLWRVDPDVGLITPALDTNVAAVTADEAHVYYQKTNVGLVRQDQAGGSPLTLASPTPPANDLFSGVLATDGNFLYYFVYNSGDVFRVSTGGGAPNPFSFGTIATNGATVSGGYLYWTPAAGPRRASLATGNPENLAPSGVSMDLCNSPVVVENKLYWGERGHDPPAVAVEGRVWRRDLATGATLMLGDKLDHVVGVVVVGPWVYFTVMGITNPSNGGVFRVAG